MGIFGIADSGNGVELWVQAVGGHAAKQVHFVRIGHSNEKIRILHAGLAQSGHGGAVALNSHHIIGVHGAVQHMRVFVNQGQVVALGRELAGQRGADLTAACNNNFHDDLPCLENG